ncbi:MAG: hypothetical protein RIR62_421 [Pseudomonadota bacterium]
MRAGLMRGARIRGRLPRTLLRTGAVVGLLLVLVWATGGLAWVEGVAASAQRAVQGQLAGAVRALRAGEGGAMLALVSLCFAYGFVHAAGPGHGKFLIGGYGVARRVGFLPLAGIAVLTALAQAAVAVALVYGGLWVLGWTRDQLVGTAEGVMTAASYAAIAAIGLWLAWRGGRGIWRGQGGQDHRVHIHDHDHDHDHGHAHDCGCGHAHAPTADQVARLTGWRDTAALVAGVAIRPCSGALFLLVLTWQLGIAGAGIAGTFAMGAGVAAVTVIVAGLAVWSREGVLSTLPGQGLSRALPVVEFAAGLAIAALALAMLARGA